MSLHSEVLYEDVSFPEKELSALVASKVSHNHCHAEPMHTHTHTQPHVRVLFTKLTMLMGGCTIDIIPYGTGLAAL